MVDYSKYDKDWFYMGIMVSGILFIFFTLILYVIKPKFERIEIFDGLGNRIKEMFENKELKQYKKENTELREYKEKSNIEHTQANNKLKGEHIKEIQVKNDEIKKLREKLEAQAAPAAAPANKSGERQESMVSPLKMLFN